MIRRKRFRTTGYIDILLFLAGCILYVLMQDYFLTDYGIFSQSRLLRTMICEWNGKFFLFYLFEKRIPMILLILFFASKRERHLMIEIGLAVIAFIWGLMLAECFIRYGGWGIMLGLSIGFPHIIFYWCGTMFALYKVCQCERKNRKVLHSIFYFIIMLTGTILENYCNPYILKAIIGKMFL